MQSQAENAPGSASAVLAVNGGSSSIKFAWFDIAGGPRRRLSGTLDRIGLPGGTLHTHDIRTNQTDSVPLSTRDHAAAVEQLVDWLRRRTDLASLAAVGHRIVHGGSKLIGPCWIDDGVLQDLRRMAPFDPDHLPGEIELIEGFRRSTPQARQAACFDTAFHRNLPQVARLLAI
ncbi:MAG: acetate/propionate family kinase, partial [Bryobacteraceae bacterium]